MESGHTRVQRAYEILRDEKASVEESASTPIGPAGRARDAILVKDHTGLFHLLAQLPDGRSEFEVPLGRVLKAVWVETRTSRGVNVWLDVACLDARLLRTFLSLIGEMLDRADTSGRHCIDELTEVLESWRAAIARLRGTMDRNRVTGIFGELTILERLARNDPQGALTAWKGRGGDRHDFARTNALEVKTLTASGSPEVTIHGELQLDPPAHGHLHLVAFRIAESSSGESIEQLVERISQHGIPHEEILRSLGDDVPGIEDMRRLYGIEEVRLHEVGDSFPGVRASRVDPSILRGVSGLTYQLALDSCPGALDPGLLDHVLEEL